MDGLALAEPVAVTLVRRGYRTLEQAREFLDANESHDPLLLGPMAAVCERIRAAIAAGRRVTVHGDYDVDGVSSTAITVRAVRELGGDCDWLIPGRQEDGYGLTMATVSGSPSAAPGCSSRPTAGSARSTRSPRRRPPGSR